MSPEDKAGYEKLVDEVEAMAKRLHEISEGAFSDMEGADSTQFVISEHLFSDLADAVRKLTRATKSVRLQLSHS